jgi:hypothetical protein
VLDAPRRALAETGQGGSGFLSMVFAFYIWFPCLLGLNRKSCRSFYKKLVEVDFVGGLSQRQTVVGRVGRHLMQRAPPPFGPGRSPQRFAVMAITRPATAGQLSCIHASKHCANACGDIASNTRRIVS